MCIIFFSKRTRFYYQRITEQTNESILMQNTVKMKKLHITLPQEAIRKTKQRHVYLHENLWIVPVLMNPPFTVYLKWFHMWIYFYSIKNINWLHNSHVIRKGSFKDKCEWKVGSWSNFYTPKLKCSCKMKIESQQICQKKTYEQVKKMKMQLHEWRSATAQKNP